LWNLVTSLWPWVETNCDSPHASGDARFNPFPIFSMSRYKIFSPIQRSVRGSVRPHTTTDMKEDCDRAGTRRWCNFFRLWRSFGICRGVAFRQLESSFSRFLGSCYGADVFRTGQGPRRERDQAVYGAQKGISQTNQPLFQSGSSCVDRAHVDRGLLAHIRDWSKGCLMRQEILLSARTAVFPGASGSQNRSNDEPNTDPKP